MKNKALHGLLFLREKYMDLYEREYNLHKSDVGTELTVEANLYL